MTQFNISISDECIAKIKKLAKKSMRNPSKEVEYIITHIKD